VVGVGRTHQAGKIGERGNAGYIKTVAQAAAGNDALRIGELVAETERRVQREQGAAGAQVLYVRDGISAAQHGAAVAGEIVGEAETRAEVIEVRSAERASERSVR